MKKHKYKSLKHSHRHKHRPKSVKPKLESSRSECRWIHDLYNIHKGSEIWVLGFGWSMDEFPDDFFKDKLAIAHKAASAAFPYCDYAWSGYRSAKTEAFLKLRGESGSKKIILGLSGGAKPSWLKWLGKDWKNPIYMEKKEVRTLKQFKNGIGSMAQSITEGKQCRYLCYITTIHFSVEAAIMLGASKVTLVGCSHRYKEGRLIAQKRGPLHYYSHAVSEDPLLWQQARLGTGLLVQTFESYGISIRRYFFKTGYERIPTLKDLVSSKRDKLGC